MNLEKATPELFTNNIDMDSVLCFVNRPWAYFTTRVLSDQLGDNWEDKPWTNAGGPHLHRHYNPECKLNKWEIYKIAYDGFWTLPYKIYPDTNHPTVSSINNDKSIPWLRSELATPKIEIMAGTTLSDFCEFMRANGGNAYIQIS
jgi:hypothetical protein